MPSRIRKNIIVIIFFFCFGSLVGFVSSRWSFFTIDHEINIVDVSNLIITALAGYYIASTLSKQLTASRVEKDLIISEIHKIRSLYDSLYNTVMRNQVSFADTVLIIKIISSSLTSLEKLAATCNFDISSQIRSIFAINTHVKAAITNDPNTNNTTAYSLSSRSIITFNTNYQLIQQQLLELVVFINRQ